MSLKIIRSEEMTMVPLHILHNPNLSLATKGAAAVMLSCADLQCTSSELATFLGVSEDRAIALCRELQDAGYENIFRVSKKSEIHE